MKNIVVTSIRNINLHFSRQQNKRVFGLDLIRAIAILLVLFSHGFDPFLSEYFPNLRKLIFMDGVDLFFVLSGFLIGSILLKQFNSSLDYSPKIIFSFWKRRWLRTLPNYFFILFVILFMPVIVPILKGNLSLIPFEVWGKFLIFSQNLFTSQVDFFSEAWSLSVEEWFYLITPLLLFLINNVFKNVFSKKIIFLIMIILVLLGSIIYRYEVGLDLSGKISDWDSNIRRVVFARLDSIMLGVLGAFIKFYFPLHWKKKKLFPYLNLLSVLLLSITHFLYIEAIDDNTNFFMNTFYFSLTGIAVMLFLPQFNHWEKPPESRLLGIVGKGITHISIISYSLYLTHGYLILGHIKRYKVQYFDKILPHSQFSGILYFTIYITISIIISTILYYSIEKTFMNMRSKEI